MIGKEILCLRDLEPVIRVNLGEHHTDMTALRGKIKKTNE